MAVLSFVRKSAASLFLAGCPAEHKRGSGAFGPSDMFFSSGEGFPSLLPTVRPIRVRAVRFAVGIGARLPYVLRARARRFWSRSYQGGMAVPRRTLRFDCGDCRLGLDPLLAVNYRRNSGGDLLACEVSESTAVVLDSAGGVAFFGGLCRPCLGSLFSLHLVFRGSGSGEALIENRFPQNIACPQHHRRYQVVSDGGLLTGREAYAVRAGVPALLLARLGIHRGLAQPFVAVALAHARGGAC